MDINKFLDKNIGELRINQKLSEYTSYKIGGCADLIIVPETNEQVMTAIDCLKRNKTRYIVIGKGSNLLFSDKGYRGAVILISDNMAEKKCEREHVKFGAGLSLSAAAKFAFDNSLGGMEALSGIPGSIGGAVYMNAGAYGREIKDIFHSAEVLRDGKIITLMHDDMRFGARTSLIQNTDDVILSCEFKLEKADKEEILQLMRKYNKMRADKQPLEYPSCGSVFKRPEGDYASRLIEEAGLKGRTVGGAMVSKKHAGFIINVSNATSSDVLGLIDIIKKDIYEKYGIKLEEEVRIIEERN